MGKPLSKKRVERRKKPRGKTSKSRKGVLSPNLENKHNCCNCTKNLKDAERVLFVEEEVGRIFCSEQCIADYFAPEVHALEQEYLSLVTPSDLAAEKREELGYLRWITLEEPDEVWREKTGSGDYRYTMISEFKPSEKSVWCVCICLLLRGDPSFLFIAFPTLSPELVKNFRRGEKVEWIKPLLQKSEESQEESVQDEEPQPIMDGLADAWTEDETLRAQQGAMRKADDIPSEEFELYRGYLEQTLEKPDEVWATITAGKKKIKLFHFIKHYPEEKAGIWYIIIAREAKPGAEGEEQIEIVDAFPTRDIDFVEQFRTGEQEVGDEFPKVASRLVH